MDRPSCHSPAQRLLGVWCLVVGCSLQVPSPAPRPPASICVLPPTTLSWKCAWTADAVPAVGSRSSPYPSPNCLRGKCDACAEPPRCCQHPHNARSAPRDALEGKGPQRRPQRRLDRRLEGVAKAVGGGFCRLKMLLKPAFVVRETVAGHRLGALEGGGDTPFSMHPCQPVPASVMLSLTFPTLFPNVQRTHRNPITAFWLQFGSQDERSHPYLEPHNTLPHMMDAFDDQEVRNAQPELSPLPPTVPPPVKNAFGVSPFSNEARIDCYDAYMHSYPIWEHPSKVCAAPH